MRPVHLFIALLALSLAGCLAIGIEHMTPEQIKATDGIASCTTITSIYGKASTITLNVESVRSKTDQRNKIEIQNDCSLKIEGTASPRFAPPVAPAAKPNTAPELPAP